MIEGVGASKANRATYAGRSQISSLLVWLILILDKREVGCRFAIRNWIVALAESAPDLLINQFRVHPLPIFNYAPEETCGVDSAGAVTEFEFELTPR